MDSLIRQYNDEELTGFAREIDLNLQLYSVSSLYFSSLKVVYRNFCIGDERFLPRIIIKDLIKYHIVFKLANEVCGVKKWDFISIKNNDIIVKLWSYRAVLNTFVYDLF